MVHRWTWTNQTHNNLEFGEESPHLFIYYILWLIARIHQHCKKNVWIPFEIFVFLNNEIYKFMGSWLSHKKINWKLFYKKFINKNK